MAGILVAAAKPSAAAAAQESPTRNRFKLNPVKWRFAAMMFMAVGLTGIAVFSIDREERIGGWKVSRLQAWEAVTVKAEPTTHFLGEPILGERVAYVFVSPDEAIQDVKNIALMADVVNSTPTDENHTFGSIRTRSMPTDVEFSRLVREAEPIPVALSTMRRSDEFKKDSEVVNAVTAFAAIRAWAPDQVFVVFSEEIPQNHRVEAAAEISSWNVPTNFFAVGPMVNSELLSFANDLGVEITPVRNELVSQMMSSYVNISAERRLRNSDVQK